MYIFETVCKINDAKIYLLTYLLIYTGDKIKYKRLSKNTKTQQENTKENTEKTTEINWVSSKKIS